MVAGVAGSGKTTLGRAIASRLGLPLLDLDQLTNPLLDAIGHLLPGDHWLSGPDSALVREGRYASLRTAAADIVSLGQGVVLVAPFTAELRGGAEWQAWAAALGAARVNVIHLVGAPELLNARRAARGENRDAFRPTDDAAESAAVPHLRIEAALEPAQQLHRALRELGVDAPLDPGHPLFTASFDAVLFDLDGTLLDSTPAVVRSWTTLAGEYGFDPAELQANHGQPARALLERLLREDQLPEAALRIAQLELDDVQGVTAIAGAARMLSALPESGKAIVTSGTKAIATARLTAAGLPVPHTLVTADDISRGKPDPEPYLLAAARLGLDPTRCLAVEDAPAGVRSARAAGCLVLGVGGTAEASELNADLWVEDLSRVRATTAGDVITLVPDDGCVA
jgi:sugar-phosphatase